MAFPLRLSYAINHYCAAGTERVGPKSTGRHLPLMPLPPRGWVSPCSRDPIVVGQINVDPDGAPVPSVPCGASVGTQPIADVRCDCLRGPKGSPRYCVVGLRMASARPRTCLSYSSKVKSWGPGGCCRNASRALFTCSRTQASARAVSSMQHRVPRATRLPPGMPAGVARRRWHEERCIASLVPQAGTRFYPCSLQFTNAHGVRP